MNIKYLCGYVVAAFLSIQSAYAVPIENSLCGSAGYAMGFFNGVGNTRLDAQLGLAELSVIYGSQYNNQSIIYETFYNSTGKGIDGTSVLQDLAEVFAQRSEEFSPDYKIRFELFWIMLSGESADAGGIWSKTLDFVTAPFELVYGVMVDFYSDFSTELVGAFSSFLSNPPTLKEYAEHNITLKALASHGYKLLFVAHSQGNLFVNKAYETALNTQSYSTENISVVHVAPASTVINGPHVLADNDIVINGLRAFGNLTVPPITAYIPLYHVLVDVTGHGFSETYLARDLDTFTQVIGHIDNELSKLVDVQLPSALLGSFTATLDWDARGDVDLHVIEPNGSHVYYRNKSGLMGRLDLDDLTGAQIEHYYATCDSDVLEEGSYLIGVNNYGAPNGTKAIISLTSTIQTISNTKSIILGEKQGSNGDSTPGIVFNVDISKDENGRFSISVD
ncbi:hypothetical protein H5185_10385 [Shewanella sp. SG44-6]|jgi:hypothetical protein|uniref:hypothetical protein n=1 Tax=Shewanella sp. SG44-6 TaxID=2760959 RepID=UPI0016039923|nr:hypothetical protein [Shewanella sp. SG44-6]MBB1389825.1 hypothetical protein [Shewanella sp. SG44-6]